MKKLICLILAFTLCLGLCSCGSKEPEGPPEPTEWVISTEYITQRVTEFAASEELKFLQDNYEATVLAYNGLDKVYGPYLTGAAEVYALYGDGEGQHFILMGIMADMVPDPSAYIDYVTVVYDVDSSIYYDSISQNRPQLQEHYASINRDSAVSIAINGGSNYREALENLPNTFGLPPTKPGYVFSRELTADEVASINTTLGLEPIPPRGKDARPELDTTPEERQQIIVDAVKQLVDSDLYYVLYPDCRRPMVEAAAEFAIVTSLDTHNIIIKLADADTNLHGDTSDRLVVDMKTGTVYSQLEFDWEAALTETEGIAYLLADVYSHILNGEEEFFWSSGEESNYKLTEEEIAAINQELTEYFNQNPIEQPTEPPTEEPAEESVEDIPVDAPAAEAPAIQSGEATVNEQFLADAVKNFQNSKRYQEVASDPGSIHITAAFEYAFSDFEGYDVHVLVVRVDNVDTDMWGFSADTFLVDIATGNIWHEGNLDMDWGDMSTTQDAYAAILSCPIWENEIVWSDMETRTALPQSMIDAANAALS